MLYLHNITSIAKKDLNGLFSERTLILTILIQLFIASFSSFLVVGLTSLYDPGSLGESDMKSASLGVAYRSEIVLNNSTLDTKTEKFVNKTLLYHLIDESKLSAVCYPDYSSAGSAFYEGEIDGIILVPDIAINGTDLADIHVYLPETDLKATVLMIQLKKPLEQFEQYIRDIRTKRLPDYRPINLNIPEKSSNHYFEFVYVVLIPLLVFTPAFISGGLVIDFITEEFEQKTIDLLLASPVTFLDILNGKILVATMIAPVQAFVWLVLLLFNGIYIHNLLIIIFFVTLITFFLVLTGVFVSINLKNRGMSQLFYSLILITLFLLCYLFPNSPMNIVARLAIDSMDNMVCIVVYLLIALSLYAAFLMRYRSMYRSGCLCQS